MKSSIYLAAAVAVLGLAACSPQGEKGAAKGGEAATGAPAKMDGPKPGLWRITTSATGMPGGAAPPAVETCVKEAKFDAPAGGASAPGADCTVKPFTREGDAMVGGSTCQMQGMKTDSTIRITGDFSSRYTMEVKTKMDPAPVPSMAETTVTMTGERIGDCPAA